MPRRRLGTQKHTRQQERLGCDSAVVMMPSALQQCDQERPSAANNGRRPAHKAVLILAQWKLSFFTSGKPVPTPQPLSHMQSARCHRSLTFTVAVARGGRAACGGGQARRGRPTKRRRRRRMMKGRGRGRGWGSALDSLSGEASSSSTGNRYRLLRE